MGAALANFLETKCREDSEDLARFEYGNRWHAASGDYDDLRADELSRDGRCSVFKDQTDDLTEIGVEFVQRLGLTVGAG